VAAVTGVAVGAWVGASFVGIYNAFFRFPTLAYRLSLLSSCCRSLARF
jgi:hypothetical protein